MAITMRKGAYADFDPSKMKAGEWAVSTDTDSNRQQVWMCFSPGVVKRMGTVEDFDMEIQILIRQYLDSMAESVEKAQESAELATSKAQESATSADKAKASEDKAKEYEESAHSTITTINKAAEATRLNKEAAAQSEANAKASEKQALSYKNSASVSEQASKASETNAKTSADNASASATSASTSASKASKSKISASASASQAKTSETNAKTSETNSAKSESEAQKYAEQAKEISESLSGALRPLGTISFANLPSTADASSGDMYNITDQFTTTADFKEGAGNIIPAGSNVYLTADRYWDVLAGTPVTGVKGAKENYYRRGNVNITPTNIGAVAEDGDASDTTVTFTEPSARENIVSGEKVSVGFGKIKKWFADLKSFAFKDLVNNLTTTTTGSALDASQGKVLNDKYDELNQSFAQVVLVNRGVLPTGADVNRLNRNDAKALTENSIYELNGANTYSNLPAGVKWGFIEVVKCSVFVLERVITNNDLFMRIYANSAWGNWWGYYTSAEIDVKHQTKLATIKVTNIKVTSRSYTQCFAKHGLTASKITGITPYVDGYPMCVVTHCWIDGDYIKWNVSNMNYAEAAIATVTVGADVRYLA